MKVRCLLVFCLIGFLGIAQDEEPLDSTAPPPSARSSSVSQMIGSGTNYYAYIPTDNEDSSLDVGNLSVNNNTILIVGEDEGGYQTKHTIVVDAQEEFTIPASLVENYKHVFLISLQPFSVKSEKFLRVFDLNTRLFNTVSPQRHLELVEVEDPMGESFIVGVTPDGGAHYPVYGVKVGQLDRERNVLMKPNGIVLDLLRK